MYDAAAYSASAKDNATGWGARHGFGTASARLRVDVTVMVHELSERVFLRSMAKEWSGIKAGSSLHMVWRAYIQKSPRSLSEKKVVWLADVPL